MNHEQTVDRLVADHHRTVRRRWAAIAALGVLAAVAFIVSTVVGPVDLRAADVLHGLVDPGSLTETQATVLWRLRLPMSVMAVLIGLALSAAGAQMQTILNNPLAEPFTLGISAAAALGGASAIVLGWVLVPVPQLNLAVIAWASAIAATAVIVAFSIWRGATSETMILLGIGLVFLFQAVLALLQYRASTEALQQIVFWTMGSLTRATWLGNGVLAVVLAVTLPIMAVLSWQLTALRLGDDRARAMGVNVSRLRIIMLVVVSVLAATAVAFAGVIGFIGLVGPHIARMLVGEDQRYFLPASMAAGAGILCAAHALSLVIVPGIAIPIGIITALVGVPFFFLIILTRKRTQW
ncbi:iron ABC transporter permease [Rothia sp. LK2588]|uniref:FecCD family ABC transporter permease n=1 Tax=Rothia sp. LK2588 TaxID=3114369 RepID=UPI0034CEF9B1